MDKTPMTRRRAALAVVIGLWLVVFCGSFWVYSHTEPTGEMYTRGMNRIAALIQWQMVAAALAVPAFWIGNGFPPGSGLRRISRVPIVWVGLMLAGVAAVLLLARF